MAKAGYQGEVYVKTATGAPSAGDKIDGILECNVSRTSDVEETTDTKDGSGYKSRIKLLKDVSIDMSGHYEASDTIQGILRTAFVDGSTVYVTVYANPAASSGFKGQEFPCLVDEYTFGTPVNGVVPFSAKLSGNGTPTDR